MTILKACPLCRFVVEEPEEGDRLICPGCAEDVEVSQLRSLPEPVASRSRLLGIAFAGAIVGSLIPAVSLVDLYQTRVGAAIRPMHLGMELFAFGLGTPICVLAFVMCALQSRNSAPRPGGFVCWSLFAIVLSLIPLGLLTFGVRWVANARSLTFKP